jgi:hypothetical protein
MGEDRVVFGSDAVWYGSPQWQIEALWRFQIPEEMQRRYGYPRLTQSIKRKILGLNSARLYGMAPGTVSSRGRDDDDHDDDHDGKRGVYKPIPRDYERRITAELKRILEYPATTAAATAPAGTPESQFPQFATDNLAKIKEDYAQAGGYRTNTRYGWLRTRA